jgi:hypothetical protein
VSRLRAALFKPRRPWPPALREPSWATTSRRRARDAEISHERFFKLHVVLGIPFFSVVQ